MATDLKTELLEEIALEGLDGVTINSLWIRLLESKTFTLKVDDSSKPYLWRCVTCLKDVEFYQMSKPRPDLIPYNRFHYVDPETKHFLETEHIPDDIYPINIINQDGVRGSCVEFATRVNVTEDIRQGKQTLEQVMEKYGNTLVAVASQKVRLRTLIGTQNDPNFHLTDQAYCIIERIGRSRYCGETSVGKMSLQVFQESNKTMFYQLKKLRRLNVIMKQRLCTIKKPSNTKISCFLFQLSKFYYEVGNKTQHELVSLTSLLSECPEQMEDVKKVKMTLKIYDKEFKKVSQMTNSSGERYFDFLDLPWREKFPDATPKEYLQKNARQEKTIRHIRFLQTMKDVKKNTLMAESSDEEEEEASDAPKLVFERSYDKPYMYEMLDLIRRSGSRGMTQIEIKKIASLSKLTVRRTVNFLQRCKYLTTVLQDHGRQKTIMYVAVENVQENKIHKSVAAEIKKYGNLAIEEKKQYVERKPVPNVHLTEVPPSEEMVFQIEKELKKIDDQTKSGVFLPAPSQARTEVMREIIDNETLIDVKIKENDLMEPDKNKSGKELFGMRRFGAMLTESHIRRANWILEVVTAIKVVENFRLLKLIRNREKEMGYSFQMDQKSMKRLVVALVQEKKMRSIQTFITMGERKRELLYLCDPTVGPENEILLRMIDQAKLRYFSISKEELKNRTKIIAAAKNPKPKKMDDIPQSAKESIQKHQEYRRKLFERAPMMKYDRKAAVKYGLLPKMLRIQAAHQYLFHLCYDTHGNQIALSNESEVVKSAFTENQPKSEPVIPETDETERNADMVMLKDPGTESDEVSSMKEPHVYFDENTWRRYLPPIPVHSGFNRGWCLISDVLLNLPVSLFCQVVNVCYDIAGLAEILNHKKRRFYPVINLPFQISQQLLHSKKYCQAFMELCGYMSEMGLLSFGQEVLKDKDQTFVYIHQNASLLDSRESMRGYNKTRIPESLVFPVKTFKFSKLSDLHGYWENLQIIALGSNLGYKSMVHPDLDDKETHQVKSLTEATKSHKQEDIIDDGTIPGDKRGAAGLDSSLFCHALKNWTYRSLSSTTNREKAYKKSMIPKGLKGGIDLESKRKVVESYNKSMEEGEEKLVLSEEIDKPVTIKKVIKRGELAKGNKGGKGIKRPFRASYIRTIRRDEGKIRMKRHIKFSSVTKPRKKPYEKGDAKDKEIYNLRMKQRVIWSTKEDSVLLMCRLAALIMDNNRKTSVVGYSVIRDYLHDKCGPKSHDKSSQACQRRLKFVLQNAQTESNLLLYFREALQDKHIVKEYVSKDYVITDETVVTKYRCLTDYLLDKFQSLNVQKCSLPENLSDLHNYSVEPLGRLVQIKEFSDATNRADICHDVLRNILHSAVLLNDKQGRTHEMFRLLTQYPDHLLSSVIKELRMDGLLVIQKKQYQNQAMENHLHMGVGVRNFKVSQRYMYNYKHRYLSTLFEESAEFLEQINKDYIEKDGEEQRFTLDFHPRGGQSAIIIPLLLQKRLDFKITIPDELVVVDMEGFYNFPWGRGKTVSSATKADKSLQDLYAKSGKTSVLPKSRLDVQGKVTSIGGKESLLDDKKKTSEAVETDLKEKPASETVSCSQTESLVTAEAVSDTKTTSQIDDVPQDQTQEKQQKEYEKSSESVEAETSSKSIGDVTAESCENQPTVGEKGLANEDEVTSTKADESLPTLLSLKNKGLKLRKNVTIKKGKISEEGKDDENVKEKEKIYITYRKGCSEIRLPKFETSEVDTSSDVVCSAMASRTLLSLRRVEDNSSFEDIRVFNAQDNFVVNSCTISVRLRDTSGDTARYDMSKTDTSAGEIGDSDGARIENDITVSDDIVDSQVEENVDKGETGKGKEEGDVEKGQNSKTEPEKRAREREKRKNVVDQLGLDKDVMKKVWTRLQELLPFKLEMDQVWETLRQNGVSVEDISMYKLVYNIVDGQGVLGIRMYDLQKQFPCGYRWREAADVLISHHAIVEVGVTSTRYVSLRHARPWVIHSYRNIKGRGLHMEEEGSNTMPMEQSVSELANIQNVERGSNTAVQAVLGDGELGRSTPTMMFHKDITDVNKDLISTAPGSDAKKARLDESVLDNNSEVTESSNNASTALESDKLDTIAKTNSSEVSELYDQKCNEQTDELEDVSDPKRRKLDIEDTKNGKEDLECGNDQSSDHNKQTVEPQRIEDTSTDVTVIEVEESEAIQKEKSDMQTRSSRKRKCPDAEDSASAVIAPATSTYDKVRLVIQPWRKPEGGVNKPILKMMLESVLLYLMMKPGSSEQVLLHRYLPYLQPMVLRNIVQILEDVGCITRQHLKKARVSLFSKPAIPEIGMEDEEEATTLYLPTEECLFRLGQFGKEMFPSAKWPSSTTYYGK